MATATMTSMSTVAEVMMLVFLCCGTKTNSWLHEIGDADVRRAADQ